MWALIIWHCSGAFQKLYRVHNVVAHVNSSAHELSAIALDGIGALALEFQEGIGERKRFVEKSVFFKDMQKEHLALFASILIKRTFSPAQELIRQGDEPAELLFISKGSVSLYREPVTFISASEKDLGLDPETALTQSQQVAATQLFRRMCVSFKPLVSFTAESCFFLPQG